MNYVLPVLLIGVFVYAFVKRTNVYQAFVVGAKSGATLTFSVFPYLAATFVMVNLFRESGLSAYVVKFLSPPFALLGIPSELVELTLLRPFSGRGSLALLSEIYQKYGADGYVARCASVMMGSTETVFYVSSVYFASANVKKAGLAVPIALFCTLIGCVLTCSLCRVM